MNKNYTLFLDETKANDNFPAFTLSGVIINDLLNDIITENVEALKEKHFTDRNIILHEMDMRKRDKEFHQYTKKQIKDFMEEFKKIYNDSITILGVTIKTDELNKFYSLDYQNDIYFIGLQIILENFCHFLLSNDGVGEIIVESISLQHDQKLKSLFYELLHTGTLFYTSDILQEKLLSISFKRKADKIIGLQIADFIPNSLSRKALMLDQKKPSFLDAINNRLYMKENTNVIRFGHKIIP